MAFQLPEHLPQGGPEHDRPTHVLNKIGQATQKALNASLTASWLAELDSSIQDTKNRISQRIYADLPAFEQQLKLSVTIQTRLAGLSATVETLTDSLNNPQTGILPTLLQALTTHWDLSEQVSDSEVTQSVLAHLLSIRTELSALESLLGEGKLHEAAQASARVQALVVEAPNPIDRADIMRDIKKRYRTLYDHLQEQLGDAYSRSIVFSSTIDRMTLMILPSTRVPPTSTLITLPSILLSLPLDLLSTRLSAFRRDILTFFVDPILHHSHSLIASTDDSISTLCLSSCSSSDPLKLLQMLIGFLNSHFFSHLPPSQVILFPATFLIPITTAVLCNLLRPSVPSSLPALPPFLATVDEAIRFEDFLLPMETKDRPIRYWADGIAGHYEKKRREDFLRRARAIVNCPEDGHILRIEVTHNRSAGSPAHSMSSEFSMNETGWDFDEPKDEKEVSGPQTIAALNGMDDDAQALNSRDESYEEASKDEEDHPSDGWGWGDDDEEGAEPSHHGLSLDATPTLETEEDPWDDDGWSNGPTPPSSQQPEPDPKCSLPVPNPAPRLGTRLEKYSARKKGAHVVDTPGPSAVTSDMIHSPPAQRTATSVQRAPSHTGKCQSEEKESYLVSARARKILEVAEEVLQEGRGLLQSDVFKNYSFERSTLSGELLVAAAPSMLELYRALYPIAHSSLLGRDLNVAMRWSNDCRFLSAEVARLSQHETAPQKDRWLQTGDRLQALAELSFEDAVGLQQEAVRTLLDRAEGFVEVSDKERFEGCRDIIEQVLERITSVARQWKETLTRSNYFRAVGQVVDDTLFRVMDDILSLEDIPEADSECLSELCELLAPLEASFVYTPNEQSVVGTHVPLWFKFSYLSWLIKGSIADLSYLFDQGMLVDYETNELVQLLRALFAETPLRENTIAKIMKGHSRPVPADSH